VLVSGLQGFRLELARRFAADEVFDASRGDLADHVRSLFPGGVDIVVETASSAATVRLGASILRNGGHLVMNGFYPPPQNLVDWHWLRGKELTVHCPNSRTRERLEATLALVASGSLRVGSLVTHEMALAEAPKAYTMLLDPKAEFLGVTIRWPTGR
jgi:threonine dehydrogenase-like Zn-dependent dehydrogenase